MAQQLAQVMQNLGAVLTLFAGLTTFALLRATRRGRGTPALGSRAAAAIYSLSAAWMLYFGFRGRSHLVVWLILIGMAALVGYALMHARRPRSERDAADSP